MLRNSLVGVTRIETTSQPSLQADQNGSYLVKELLSRSYPDGSYLNGGDEPAISIRYEPTRMEVTFVKELPDGNYLDGDDKPAISSIRYEPTRMEVTFVKELTSGSYPDGYYPDGGDEPTISSIGYEPTDNPTSPDRLDVRLAESWNHGRKKFFYISEQRQLHH